MLAGAEAAPAKLRLAGSNDLQSVKEARLTTGRGAKTDVFGGDFQIQFLSRGTPYASDDVLLMYSDGRSGQTVRCLPQNPPDVVRAGPSYTPGMGEARAALDGAAVRWQPLRMQCFVASSNKSFWRSLGKSAI
jgi:hypothetical protein